MLDTSVIGRIYGPREFLVEAGKIREFALALGDTNPLYHDAGYARQTPFSAIVAPPTFATVLNFWVEPDTLYQDLGIDMRYLLHGEQEYEYFRPIRPGMTLRVTRQCTQVYQRPAKERLLEFALIESDIRDAADDGRVMLARATLVLRWPVGQEAR